MMGRWRGLTVFLGLMLAGCGEDPQPPPEPPPAPVYRYRQPSASPRFGQDWDFAGAVSGAIPGLKSVSLVRSGILVDLDTHRVLWEKNALAAQPIASLTKLMTFFVVMEELEKADKPDFDSLVTVSTASTRANPVKINLVAGEKVRLEDLMTATMMLSANDAAQQVAEYFGDGRMEVFVARMNDAARTLGMTETTFFNPNGLPIYRKDRETLMNRASPRDLIVLIERLEEYPQLYDWTAARQREYRAGTQAARTLNNTNRLLGSVPGVNGLKTGYTDAAGHCLAFSVERDGRRLAGIALGFSKRDDLFAFCRELIEWGFKNPR